MPIPVKKISAYNPKNTIVDNDTMLVAAKGETYNATAKVFMEYVKNHPEMDALFATDAQLESVRKTLASTISAETSRAKSAESTLTTNLDAEISRAKKAENDIQNVIDSNKNNWNDKYTKNEIDNKFSALENNIDWKESVATFDDIAKTYPTPQDGWTVNVKDTDYTYRYSGSKWVIISANAIPKATQSVDGLLTASDKTNYDDANSKKHTHSNKSVLDGITSTLVAAWNKVADKLDKTGDASNVTTVFTTATTRSNLTPKEKLSISLGKISKYFSDLKTVAFTGSYNDLINRPTSMTANGGNSATVNGHTVNSDVPSGAKFTDTVYTHPTGDGNKHIPANGTTNNGKYLKATGTAGSYQWGNITKNDVIKALGYTPGTSSAEPLTYSLSKLGSEIILTSSNGDTTSATDSDTTYSNMKGATTSATGTSGLVPAPSTGAANRYLRSDGTWAVPPDNNTTYSNFVKSGSGAKSGLVPAPSTTAGTTKYLREDGTWQTPSNTWRGIQDNLTSTSTTESLSAKQGKNLKTSVDNKIIKNSSSTAPTTQDNGGIWLKEYT